MKALPFISLESPDQPEVAALIKELDAYQTPLYPAESDHGINIDALSSKNVLFAVGRLSNGEAVACGALVLHPTHGELKRMFTKPAFRGQGIAGGLLIVLENAARRHNCFHLLLETGYLQNEAISFYERSGYQRRGPFGGYEYDPNSMFLEKRLEPQPARVADGKSPDL